MISAAAGLFIIALIAAFLDFSGIAGEAINIAWILALAGIVLAVIFAIIGRARVSSDEGEL